MAGSTEERRPPVLVVAGEPPSERAGIKGFVTAAELVFGLAADFLKGAPKNGPIFRDGQLESGCLEGANRRIGEVMVPIRGCVQKTEVLMEAVFLFNKAHARFLLVVNQENVVGILPMEEILEEITRMVLGE